MAEAKKLGGAGLRGQVAGETALCTVGKTGTGLTYRGYDITDLADNAQFEEVAYLLLRGKLPNQAELDAYKTKLKSLRNLPEALKLVLEGAADAKGRERFAREAEALARLQHPALVTIHEVGEDDGKDKLDEKLARAREALNKPKKVSSGKQPAMATFEATRPSVGAQAVGVARAAYEYALDYAQERTAFGKPIIMNQSIAFMLADMVTEIDASRLLVHRAAWLSKNGKYVNAEGSQSKLKAGRTAVWVTERAIQILGGYGYTREYPVERMHRDSKIFDIFEGTEQIQQLVISRAISGLRIE